MIRFCNLCWEEIEAHDDTDWYCSPLHEAMFNDAEVMAARDDADKRIEREYAKLYRDHVRSRTPRHKETVTAAAAWVTRYQEIVSEEIAARKAFKAAQEAAYREHFGYCLADDSTERV